MIYTVNYSKRNSFFTKKHDILTINDSGRKEVVGEYNKPNAPGSVFIYKPKFKNGKLVADLTQQELNDLVKDMFFFDKSTGEKIDTANIRNMGDKFFKHDDLYLRIENGAVNLNDEIPLDKFFLACMRSDPKFHFVNERSNPAMSAIVTYTVKRVGDITSEESQEVDRGVKAMEMFLAMDFNKRVKVLNAMGTSTKNPEPEQVQNALYNKIVKEATAVNHVSGETNIDMFIRLGSEKSEELELQTIVSNARNSRIIGKVSQNFTYGDLKLGRTLKDVYQFLSNDDNIDIRNQIIKELQHGKNTD